VVEAPAANPAKGDADSIVRTQDALRLGHQGKAAKRSKAAAP